MKPRCSICTKPCEESDRNSDGTYAHDNCLRGNQTQPSLPTEKK